MTNNEILAASIDQALSDEKFRNKLHDAAPKEEIIRLFSEEKGITLDNEIAQAAFDKLESLRNGEELTEEDLQYAAGGLRILRLPIFNPAPGAGFNADISGYGPRGPFGINIAIRSWWRR